MPGKILRRCDICGKFHAAYLVPNPQGGQMKLCRSCWDATAAGKNPQPPVVATTKTALPHAMD